MKFPMTAIALALASAGMTAPAQSATVTSAVQEEPKLELNKDERKAIVALQDAIVAAQWDQVPALADAANKVAKGNDAKLTINRLLIKAALDQKDLEGAIAPIDAIAALGAPMTELVPVYVEVGKQRLFDNNLDGAADALEKALKYAPGSSDALVALAEVRVEQNRTADGIKLMTDAIAAAEAAGTPDENWYKRAVRLAFDAEDTSVYDISRRWLRAYPNATNWRDALRIYMGMSNASPDVLIDAMRLQNAAGALESEGDYLLYAEELLRAGYPGEAMAVINAGKQANAFDMNKRIVSEIVGMAETQSKGDRASLDADFGKVAASPDPKKSITLADAYYGYGDYQKAAELYRAALGKSGVPANVANLRLGMTLARAGDYAAAKEVLAQVGGAQKDVAEYWLAWIDTVQ